jgi:hypothetical protein
MSPASNSFNNTIEWFLCVLVGKVIGLRPAVDHLLFKTDVNMILDFALCLLLVTVLIVPLSGSYVFWLVKLLVFVRLLTICCLKLMLIGDHDPMIFLWYSLFQCGRALPS